MDAERRPIQTEKEGYGIRWDLAHAADHRESRVAVHRYLVRSGSLRLDRRYPLEMHPLH